MAWHEAVVTNSGMELIAASLTAGNIVITQAIGGESRNDPTSLLAKVTIEEPIHNLNIAKITTEANGITVNVRIQNERLDTAYILRQIGLFARLDGTDNDVLFAVIQDETGESIPSSSENPEFLVEFDFMIPVSNTDSISIALSPNTFATIDDVNDAMQEHIDDTSNPHKVTKEQVELGNVPNVTTNDQTPTYTVSETLTELTSGEKLSLALGKIAKGIKDLITHLSDGVKHITADERTAWNSKSTASVTPILTSGTKVATITVDNKPTDVYCQNTTYSEATTSVAGLLSAVDKTKLDGIAESANNYTLPTAGSTLGGVKTTSTVTSNSGYTACPIISGVPYYKDTNTTYSTMTGATSSAAGTSGLVPTPAAGKQTSFLRGDGTWVVPTNTTYSNMTGATTDAAGTSGLVPAPAAGAQAKYLRGDGTWQTPTNTTYSVATTSANGLMSSTDKAKLNYTNIAYGTCATAAATAEKVIAISGNSNWALTSGSMITVKFTYTNTASNPTFNVNGTGAKSVWYNTALITTASLGYAGTANRPANYIYDGTQYVFIGWSMDANSTYTNASLGQGYGTCTTEEATVAKVVTLSSYSLITGGIVSVKFTYAVPASATMNINSKGAKAIFYKGAAITAGIIKAGDIVTFIYDGTQYQVISFDRDTNTNTTYSAGTGLSLSGTTFNHSNSVTAGTAQGDASKTLSFGGTFTVPTVTYDTQGHITAKGTTTMTMPANPNTDTKVTNTLATTTKAYVTGTTSSTTNTGTQVFDTGVYLDTTAGMLTATTFTGALTGNASTATQVYSTLTTPGTAATYYIPAHSSNSTANKSLSNFTGLSTSQLHGTTDTDGYSILILGNSTASGTAANKYGALRMYGTGTYYTTFRPYATANATKYLVGATSASAVGSTSIPVYVNSAGTVTPCGSLTTVVQGTGLSMSSATTVAYGSRSKALIEIWNTYVGSSASSTATVYDSVLLTGMSTSMTAISTTTLLTNPTLTANYAVSAAGVISLYASQSTAKYRVTWFN